MDAQCTVIAARPRVSIPPLKWATCCGATVSLTCVNGDPTCEVPVNQISQNNYRVRDSPKFSGTNGGYLWQGDDQLFINDMISNWINDTAPEDFSVTEAYRDRYYIPQNLSIGNVSWSRQEAVVLMTMDGVQVTR